MVRLCKKLLCCILLISLIIGNNTIFAEVNYNSVSSLWQFNSKGVELISDHPAFTQKDLENNFANYASKEATKKLLNVSSNNLSHANVVGIVLDYATKLPVSNATINVKDIVKIQTDDNGQFQILNIPNGTYNWTITSEGYQESNYLNYLVDGSDGTTIFTFYIDKDKAILINSDDFYNSDSHLSDHLFEYESAHDISTQSMSTPPNVVSYISVLLPDNSVINVERQQYIYTVVSKEMYSVSYYTDRGLTTSQVNSLYVAQALAASTFAEYAAKVYSKHRGVSYVCSTECCQVYDPTRVTQAAINAVAVIFEKVGQEWYTPLIMYKPTSTTYSYIWGAYSSSCYNKGTLTHPTEPALKAKSCTDLATGSGGHRYGMCQMGAAQLAKNGYLSTDIIHYYYSNCSLPTCKLQ